MISDAYQFIFIHINKTGGTSIEKVFERNADQRDVPLKHASVSEIQAQYPQAFARYFKFSFVRNPWDWLVSRYHWSRNKQGLFDYSFTEFLERLANGETLSAQAPWLQQALAPQVSRLKLNGQLAVDFISIMPTTIPSKPANWLLLSTLKISP